VVKPTLGDLRLLFDNTFEAKPLKRLQICWIALSHN
jgi:hypothetical protein